MSSLTRRTFLGASTVYPFLAAGAGQAPLLTDPEPRADERIYFAGDGLPHTPTEYAQLLGRLAKDGQATEDNYLMGGCVAELERQFAEELGKEQGLFMPTGTLANHLALRVQAGVTTRVLVQAESHIYRDSLDCVQTLSHLNLVPVGTDKATVLLPEVEEAFRRSAEKPFPLRVGAISLECPVRRKAGETFEIGEMRRVAAFARKHDIRMHLDGARLWIASAYTGVTPREYADLFDTVYVSLYKCFNAGSGAVLVGPRAVIEQVAHARKVFGGGLYQAWPYAAVASYYLEGFAKRYQKAVEVSRMLFERLGKHPRFRIEQIPNGSNVIRLHVRDVDTAKYQQALQERGIFVPVRGTDFTGFELTINESLNRLPVHDLVRIFVDSLPTRNA